MSGDISGIVWIDTPIGLKVAETPITQAQWINVMGQGTEPEKLWGIHDPLLPATHVNWYEAAEFAKVVGGRLPSSEELRLLAVAGRDELPKPLVDYAVFDRREICPVRTKQPNDWGLYDTVGLVWEWCLDGKNGSKWLRGGSWDSFGYLCRSAIRFDLTPDSRYDFVGFRVIGED